MSFIKDKDQPQFYQDFSVFYLQLPYLLNTFHHLIIIERFLRFP